MLAKNAHRCIFQSNAHRCKFYTREIVSVRENPEHFLDLYDLLDKTSKDLIGFYLVGNL